MDPRLQTVIEYMKSHWPSQVKDEWQVKIEDYPAIVKKVVAVWTKDATTGHELVRIAGLSGSGKTTQLLPAVENYFKEHNKQPVLVAARRFVEFHPFVKEIEATYGSENLRKMTDEFSTIMMFLTLSALIEQGYDIILDVTLLDPKIEGTLMQMLAAKSYQTWLTMIAVSPEITEKFLGARAWRHSKATEEEFIRATAAALNFYHDNFPETRIVLWNVWDLEPIYDGEIKDAIAVFEKYSHIANFTPEATEETLREAKIAYLNKK